MEKYCIENIITDTKGNRIEEKKTYYSTKEEAWEKFSESICEYYDKDFWIYMDWGPRGVQTTHADEEGCSDLVLLKWEGFDDEIEFAWKYKGEKYPTYEDLCKEYPIFEGCGISDKPWIFPVGHKEGDPLAGLYYKAFGKEVDFSFDGYDPKERENEEPRRRKRNPEYPKDQDINNEGIEEFPF